MILVIIVSATPKNLIMKILSFRQLAKLYKDDWKYTEESAEANIKKLRTKQEKKLMKTKIMNKQDRDFHYKQKIQNVNQEKLKKKNGKKLNFY